ncbi:MAG TPA: prepilin-type N-terminal cleavage/methylation domain-containing protein [Thermoanaerobaculia bacterium]|nr:prepilin-type N-terminal cleavage/methylation domain-containing protein [Thermoanaerobaculia bacterium]
MNHGPFPIAMPRQAGFTLVEMIVSLAITALLLVGVLATFDLNSRITRVETHVADMQQSMRIAQDDIVRTVRMAGRGGLTLADAANPLPQGVAISFRDNVADDQLMVATDPETRIVAGTDVLTVRGVLGTLYQSNVAGSLTLVPAVNPTSGTLVITDPSPGGAAQDLTPLKTAIADGVPEAILLVSTLDDTINAVVELNPGASVVGANSVTLAFRVSGSAQADAYGKLSPGGVFPAALQNVSYAGILEEYRYYIREDHAIPNDRASDLTPKLVKARFFPGTDQPYRGQAINARLDLADNILDLQVAFGFDTTNLGSRAQDEDHLGQDDEIAESDDGQGDDWLFNAAADQPTDAVWQNLPPEYVRISTLARTDRRDPDPNYRSPLLPERIENRAYPATDPANSDTERKFRRRRLQTLIDLRNL